MNAKRLVDKLSELRVLRYFPADEHALLAVVRMVNGMADNEEQVDWLVNRMVSGIYAEWPGPQELRACFCSRFKPKDGINAYSTVYDTFPPDPSIKPKQIEAPTQQAKRLEAGKVSADEGIQKAMEIAASVQRVKNAGFAAPATPEEIAAAPDWLRKLEGYE